MNKGRSRAEHYEKTNFAKLMKSKRGRHVSPAVAGRPHQPQGCAASKRKGSLAGGRIARKVCPVTQLMVLALCGIVTTFASISAGERTPQQADRYVDTMYVLRSNSAESESSKVSGRDSRLNYATDTICWVHHGDSAAPVYAFNLYYRMNIAWWRKNAGAARCGQWGKCDSCLPLALQERLKKVKPARHAFTDGCPDTCWRAVNMSGVIKYDEMYKAYKNKPRWTNTRAIVGAQYDYALEVVYANRELAKQVEFICVSPE